MEWRGEITHTSKLYRDFELCTGLQGFTPFVQGFLVAAKLLCFDFIIPNS